MTGMDSFPAYFPLAGRKVVIVGSDVQAEGKARLFEGSPAELVRIDDGRALDPDTYRGAALVFISGEDEAFARMAAQAARRSMSWTAPSSATSSPRLWSTGGRWSRPSAPGAPRRCWPRC